MKVALQMVAVFLPLCGISALLADAAAEEGLRGFDPSSLQRFTAGAPYLDKYETGLYPGGNNDIPKSHRRAGEKIAATIRPLDASGEPDDEHGRILALVFGHSNCRMYFGALQRHLATHREELHPRFELLNAAVGGNQLPQIVALRGPVWDQAARLTSQGGYSPKQVQVLFLHTTYHGASNGGGRPPGPFPETMQRMQEDLQKVLAHCVKTYPNLKIAYLTSDGFRHYTRFEPHVWQEAFALKWLIESQIEGRENTNFEGDHRTLPWLQWGPYIWDNSWDKTYFTDGVHPSEKAQNIFVESYWEFLKQDPVAHPWLLKPPSEPSRN